MKQKLTEEEKADKHSKAALVVAIVMFILNIICILLANLDKILPIPH